MQIKITFSKIKNIYQLKRTSDFENSMFWDSKLFKMSQFFGLLTSSTLTPYYSYRAQEICSTSHFDILELWEPSWNDPEQNLETSFFHQKLHFLSPTCVILRAAVLRRVSSVYNNSWTNLLYKCKESMGETDVFFERLAPEKNEKYSSKNYNF